MFVLTI